MSRLLTDSWEQDKHFSLKRWERGAQRNAWSQRAAEHAAPPLPCPWRALPTDPVAYRQAHLLALFSGDLAVVRFSGDAQSQDYAGLRVLRGGIPWDRWCPVLLNAYSNGGPVPDPFRPRMRIPPQWLERLLNATPEEQRAFLDKLRESGALPPLRVMNAEAMAPWMRWEEVRGRFLDFKE